MMIVGLTGGLGAGKSFVAGIFKKLGAKIVDADRLAHLALKKSSATYRRVVSVFGDSILDAQGLIDRRKLGRIVFDDKRRLSELNRIVHPVVIGKIRKSIASFGKGVLVVDAPLICEANLSGLFDVLVVVKSSKSRQIERSSAKLGLNKKDALKRIACQTPIGEKIKKADYVVDNNGTRKETERKVLKIWQEIKRGGKPRNSREKKRGSKKGARLWR